MGRLPGNGSCFRPVNAVEVSKIGVVGRGLRLFSLA
jgi:hypothetical protein